METVSTFALTIPTDTAMELQRGRLSMETVRRRVLAWLGGEPLGFNEADSRWIR